MHSLDSYVLLDKFNPNEYEYIIFEEFGLIKQLNRILLYYVIHIIIALKNF